MPDRRTGAYSVPSAEYTARSRKSLSISQLSEIMSQISTFYYGETPVRAIVHNGQPWIVLVDVCRALGYKNKSDLHRRIGPDEKCRLDIGLRNTLAICVNRDGLLRVTMFSQKKPAQHFQDWAVSTIFDAYQSIE